MNMRRMLKLVYERMAAAVRGVMARRTEENCMSCQANGMLTIAIITSTVCERNARSVFATCSTPPRKMLAANIKMSMVNNKM